MAGDDRRRRRTEPVPSRSTAVFEVSCRQDRRQSPLPAATRRRVLGEAALDLRVIRLEQLPGGLDAELVKAVACCEAKHDESEHVALYSLATGAALAASRSRSSHKSPTARGSSCRRSTRPASIIESANPGESAILAI